MHAWHTSSMQISLTDLRRTPAAALDSVRAGEEITVTDAGVPFMRMVPIARPTRYEHLLAAGVLQPPQEPRDLDEVRARSLAGWVAPTA